MLAAVLLAGCTTDGSIASPTAPQTTPAPTGAVTSASIVPVTPDGLSTGPGVTDESITLGLLVDPERDRGFSQGVDLWRASINNSGGICGRTVELIGNGRSGLPADPVEAYDTVGLNSLGMLVLPGTDEVAALNSSVAADQIPALTSEGTSEQLGPDRPIIVGATDDVLVINVLDHLRDTGRLDEGDTIGVLADDSPSTRNAVAGVRWWADRWDVTADVRPAGAAPAAWSSAAAVVALVGADDAGRVVQDSPTTQTVVLLPDAYRPAEWSADAQAAVGRVLIGLPTPAAGSDNPATQAVVAAFARDGDGATPDLRLLTGYATATSWGRLLTAACDERLLTRRGIETVVQTVGPAPADALFGPSDPALPVESGLPATLESAVGRGAATAAGGVAPVTALISADGIDTYLG